MCGIAGIIDLSGQARTIAPWRIRAMAAAIVHRGPDEDGFLELPGLAFANRRLSIVGLADGRQPIYNEDRSVAVVFNGEVFDYREQRAFLESKGHRFVTHCDTEILPHRWEDHQEGMLDHLRSAQFAVALYDAKRRCVLLARDHFGICPIFWTRQGDWLLFASEVKALLASGMVDARLDPYSLDQIFTYFALPGPRTMFMGVDYLLPGHYLRIDLGGPGERARITDRAYWMMDFPDEGQEQRLTAKQIVEGFEGVILPSIERRLRADVPVVSYLSGGVDSSTVVAMASKVRGSPIPCFTIRVKTPRFDETSEATMVARHVGVEPVIVDFGTEEALSTYPILIESAEKPVIDTSTAALLLLSKEVHDRGYKVVLTGEGADEFLAGYPWHKVNRLFSLLDVVPGAKLSQALRRFYMWVSGGPMIPREYARRAQAAVGGHNGWLDIYGLVSLSRYRFFSKDLLLELKDYVPYEHLEFHPRLRRWHPLNRELYMSTRVHLGGHLLYGKGDRIAMHNSVETRYPFLDLAVHDFLAKIDPRWKLRGLTGDKRALRVMAERWVPHQIARRQKAMFRAPFDSFHLDPAPKYVEQLMSAESLRKTGYFDPEGVTHWRKHYRSFPSRGGQRASIEMGLVGVFSTQLWHHIFVDGSLCELPSRAATHTHNGHVPGEMHAPLLSEASGVALAPRGAATGR
jgi:asparagine synthase (glutamine-hydrolysing)